MVGPNTKKRKHVDWEIYAGLRSSIHGNAGLVGIMLPTITKSDNGGYFYSDMPSRLADNVFSGYAQIYSWDYAIRNFDAIIEEAFNNRISKRDKINNSRLQMQRNV